MVGLSLLEQFHLILDMLFMSIVVLSGENAYAVLMSLIFAFSCLGVMVAIELMRVAYFLYCCRNRNTEERHVE